MIPVTILRVFVSVCSQNRRPHFHFQSFRSFTCATHKCVQFNFFKPVTKIIQSWQHWMLLRTAKAFTFLTWKSWVLAGTKVGTTGFVINCFWSHKIYAVFLSTNRPQHLLCTRTWAGGTLLLWWRRYAWSSCLTWNSLNLIKYTSPRSLLLNQMLFQTFFSIHTGIFIEFIWPVVSVHVCSRFETWKIIVWIKLENWFPAFHAKI